MSTLRWGILSTADIGRRRSSPGSSARPRCEVVAIASRDAEAARRPSPTSSGIERGPRLVRGAAGRPGRRRHLHPAAQPPPRRVDDRRGRAGKHVLCEKPLAMTAADAERMVEACAAEGVRLMEAFMYRLHPSWVAVRELVDVRPDRPADGRPELVLVLQRRPGQHPQHPRRRRRRAVRHRLLQREPVADAVRRRADACPGVVVRDPVDRRRHR